VSDILQRIAEGATVEEVGRYMYVKTRAEADGSMTWSDIEETLTALLAREREACARVADEYADTTNENLAMTRSALTREICREKERTARVLARRIRERGEQ
jgi:hypothetical protein